MRAQHNNSFKFSYQVHRLLIEQVSVTTLNIFTLSVHFFERNLSPIVVMKPDYYVVGGSDELAPQPL